MKWIDRMPLGSVAILGLALAFAPFYPEPHLWQKLKMLADGTLVRPIDIFDLLFHAAGPTVLAIKIIRMRALNHKTEDN